MIFPLLEYFFPFQVRYLAAAIMIATKLGLRRAGGPAYCNTNYRLPENKKGCEELRHLCVTVTIALMIGVALETTIYDR